MSKDTSNLVSEADLLSAFEIEASETLYIDVDDETGSIIGEAFAMAPAPTAAPAAPIVAQTPVQVAVPMTPSTAYTEPSPSSNFTLYESDLKSSPQQKTLEATIDTISLRPAITINLSDDNNGASTLQRVRKKHAISNERLQQREAQLREKRQRSKEWKRELDEIQRKEAEELAAEQEMRRAAREKQRSAARSGDAITVDLQEQTATKPTNQQAPAPTSKQAPAPTSKQAPKSATKPSAKPSDQTSAKPTSETSKQSEADDTEEKTLRANPRKINRRAIHNPWLKEGETFESRFGHLAERGKSNPSTRVANHAKPSSFTARANMEMPSEPAPVKSFRERAFGERSTLPASSNPRYSAQHSKMRRVASAELLDVVNKFSGNPASNKADANPDFEEAVEHLTESIELTEASEFTDSANAADVNTFAEANNFAEVNNFSEVNHLADTYEPAESLAPEKACEHAEPNDLAEVSEGAPAKERVKKNKFPRIKKPEISTPSISPAAKIKSAKEDIIERVQAEIIEPVNPAEEEGSPLGVFLIITAILCVLVAVSLLSGLWDISNL